MQEPETGMRTRTVVSISAVLLLAMIMVSAQGFGGDESAVITTMRAIGTAQTQYMRTYSDVGYACDLAALGPDPKGGPPSAKYSGLLAESVTRGKERNGYNFKVECKQKTKPQSEYRSSAVPAKKGAGRAFCIDEGGVLKFSSDGEAKSCFAGADIVK